MATIFLDSIFWLLFPQPRSFCHISEYIYGDHLKLHNPNGVLRNTALLT